MGTRESVNVAALDHALHLSADFHEGKRTGQLFRAVDRGYNVTTLLEFGLFGLGPLLLDIVIAVGYLYILFGPYMGLIAVAMAVTYFLTSSRLSSALDDKWKKYLDRCETTWSTVYGAVAHWYTVSVSRSSALELVFVLILLSRFSTVPIMRRSAIAKVCTYLPKLDGGPNLGPALEAQREASLEHRWSVRWIGAVQSLALTGGLCAACYLAVYQVLQGSQPLGNFVILLSYWSRASGMYHQGINTNAGLR